MKEAKQLNYDWYIIVTSGGKSEKIINDIKLELSRKEEQWLDYIHDLRVGPEILKNYIFCYCSLTKKLVSFFYQIKGIISFLNHERGSLQLPDPVSETTVKKTFSYLEEEKKEVINSKSSSLLPIGVGDYVKITGGIFTNHEGRIIYLKKENNRAGVEIYFFNRNIAVNLSINNCQKIV